MCRQITAEPHKLKSSSTPGRLRVVTMNLRFGLADDGPNSWDFRRESYIPLFDRREPDFVGFQEANDFQIDFLRSVLPGYGVIGQRLPAPSFWQNNVIFYRSGWTCEVMAHLFLSPTPDIPSRSPKSRWPRQCTMGLFESGGLRVICINTHLDFDAEVQAESAFLILRQLATLPPDVPAILMGDFNAGPESSAHTVFSGDIRDEAQGSKRAFVSAFASTHPGTYHGYTGIADGRHIDWIMFCVDLQVAAAEVICDRGGEVYPSDHFPLQIDFYKVRVNRWNPLSLP